MKKILLIFILSFNLILAENTANIASFNVLHLGWNNKKDYKTLAEIISLFDITGLVEVTNEKGLTTLKERLEKISGEKWEYHISNKSVGTKSYKEFYAYIYKKNKVKFIKSHGFYKEKNTRDFIREPYGADFKIGNFDFTMVMIHSIFGDSKIEREEEAKLFDEVYDYFQEINGKEQDVLIAGDFNLPAYDSAFKGLLSHKDKIFYGIDPSNKTTIGKSGLANSYDNIFFSYIYTKEFTGNYGVYDFTKDKSFDKKYGKEKYKFLRKYVSDHLPVFMEFDTSKDDD